MQTAKEKELMNYYYEIAKNCQDLDSVRKEVDRINLEILRLLCERTAYVKRAGDLKSQTTGNADDPNRVADQENAILLRSHDLDIPKEISLPVFRAIMEHSIRFQQEYINRLLV